MLVRKLLSAAALFAALNAWAAPANTESVEELLAITKTGAVMESSYAAMDQMMRRGMQQGLQGKTLTPEQQRVVDAVPAKFIVIMREEYSWERMKPQYVQLYRDTFDQEEVEGLIAFYRTPAGQAYIAKLPVVMQKSIALAQSMMQTLAPRFAVAMKEAMAEAKIAR